MENAGRVKLILSLCLAMLLLLAAAAQADTVFEGSSLTDVSLFGSLRQNYGSLYNTYGNYGCPPTATANALVFLQRKYGSIYDTSLTNGDMVATATTLGNAIYMNWQAIPTGATGGNITGAIDKFRDQVWGVHDYIEGIGSLSGKTNYSAQMYWPSGYGWGAADYPARTKPAWVTDNTYPTEQFLFTALSNWRALVINWRKSDANGILDTSGASHDMTVTGLTYDSETHSGTLYYIDPKDGSQHSSSIYQADSGGLVLENYGDWSQTWWYKGDAEIVMAESFGPVPLPSTLLLLGSGLLGLLGVGRRFKKN